jgi:hypothetical protein
MEHAGAMKQWITRQLDAMGLAGTFDERLVMAGVVCVILYLAWSARRTLRWWRAGASERLLKRRQRRAGRAEEDAAGVLRAHGYSIEEDQAEHHWHIGLDGEPFEVELRADYLVSRGGRRYVAEVKSGHMAPSLGTAATRRQLLEYRVAYDVDGILLVDMEAVRLHRVDFGDRVEGRESGWMARARSFLGGVACGAIAVSAILWFYLT